MRSTFLAAIIMVTTCVARAVPVSTVDIEHTGYGANGQLRVWGGGLFGSYVRGGIYMLDKTAGTGEGTRWADGRFLRLFPLDKKQDLTWKKSEEEK